MFIHVVSHKHFSWKIFIEINRIIEILHISIWIRYTLDFKSCDNSFEANQKCITKVAYQNRFYCNMIIMHNIMISTGSLKMRTYMYMYMTNTMYLWIHPPCDFHVRASVMWLKYFNKTSPQEHHSPLLRSTRKLAGFL